MSVDSRLKATKIIGQRKAFYRQRLPKSSCATKETADINILGTSRNGDRKIMQSIRIMSRTPLRKRKWNQLSQFWRTSTKAHGPRLPILSGVSQLLKFPPDLLNPKIISRIFQKFDATAYILFSLTFLVFHFDFFPKVTRNWQ